jgi:hypothetical protein
MDGLHSLIEIALTCKGQNKEIKSKCQGLIQETPTNACRRLEREPCSKLFKLNEVIYRQCNLGAENGDFCWRHKDVHSPVKITDLSSDNHIDIKDPLFDKVKICGDREIKITITFELKEHIEDLKKTLVLFLKNNTKTNCCPVSPKKTSSAIEVTVLKDLSDSASLPVNKTSSTDSNSTDEESCPSEGNDSDTASESDNNSESEDSDIVCVEIVSRQGKLLYLDTSNMKMYSPEGDDSGHEIGIMTKVMDHNACINKDGDFFIVAKPFNDKRHDYCYCVLTKQCYLVKNSELTRRGSVNISNSGEITIKK